VGISDDKLKVIDKTTVVTEKGFKLVFVPYVPPERYFEAINTKKDEIGDFNTIDGFISHEEFYGCSMNSVQSIHGTKWPKEYPINISGHIHMRSKPQENIVYVGSSRQTTFAEVEDKYISLFTFRKGQKYPDEKLISLNLPKKMTCRVSAKDVLNWTPPKNAIIKLIVEGTSNEIKAITKLDYIKQLAKKGIKIVYDTYDEIAKGTNDKINKQEIKLPYQQRLVNSIKEKPQLLEWYNYIFNKPK
jgi:hypothetical protein